MKNANDKNSGKLIIANCSGFFGDRVSAAREMVQGGPIDFLTGDYLAELTMALLFRGKLKNPNGGYVPTFLRQMEEVMGECLDKGIRIVANAGGLNPRGLMQELRALSEKLGLKPTIACIEGDDILPRLSELQGKGEDLAHLDSGVKLKDAKGMPITANAYLGGWGIVEALNRGADIVIGGRIADAALVVGPAAWKFGWKKTDWDRLAGAVVAGHIIECSTQATGGNYSFIDEIPSYKRLGFPIAEVIEDGSFVLPKHPGTGGLVSVDTVKAQLLYEIREPAYLTPDVIARFDTIEISQEAPDRVKVTGVRGAAPTDTTKVCLNVMGGYRNSMTLILTGLDIEKKARIFEEAFLDSVGGRDQYEKLEIQLIPSQKDDPESNETAFAYLRVTARDMDQKKIDRFSAKIVELGLANIPGFTATAPPEKGRPVIVHWPALVSTAHIEQRVVVAGKETLVPLAIKGRGKKGSRKKPAIRIPRTPGGKKVKVPLGRIFATRSGDKGGNANLGVWAKSPEAYAFLRRFLSSERLAELLPDLRGYEIERYEMPNLLAVNFYIKGILGDGVAASFRADPQAKTLGEYLRAKIIKAPASLVGK